MDIISGTGLYTVTFVATGSGGAAMGSGGVAKLAMTLAMLGTCGGATGSGAATGAGATGNKLFAKSEKASVVRAEPKRVGVPGPDTPKIVGYPATPNFVIVAGQLEPKTRTKGTLEPLAAAS